MNDRYASADVFSCRSKGHHFKLVGSDKTPMKRSLECTTCTEASGKSTFVAYGVETTSWGQWRRQAIPRERQEVIIEDVE